MFFKIVQKLLHLCFLVSRPMTLGVRGIVYSKTEDSVLLVKHSYFPGWDFPGGGVEVGETVQAALSRELKEESGIIVKNFELLELNYNHRVSRRDHVAYFLIDNFESIQNFTPNNFEILNVQWFDLKQLPSDLSFESKLCLGLLKNTKKSL